MGEVSSVKDPLLNITPYVTGSASASKPYEDYYDTPVYDMRDLTGAFDDDGNPIADAPDNPASSIGINRRELDRKIIIIYL